MFKTMMMNNEIQSAYCRAQSGTHLFLVALWDIPEWGWWSIRLTNAEQWIVMGLALPAVFLGIPIQVSAKILNTGKYSLMKSECILNTCSLFVTLNFPANDVIVEFSDKVVICPQKREIQLQSCNWNYCMMLYAYYNPRSLTSQYVGADWWMGRRTNPPIRANTLARQSPSRGWKII